MQLSLVIFLSISIQFEYLYIISHFFKTRKYLSDKEIRIFFRKSFSNDNENSIVCDRHNTAQKTEVNANATSDWRCSFFDNRI